MMARADHCSLQWSAKNWHLERIYNFVASRAINAAAQILPVDAFANDKIVCFSRFRGGALDIINLMQSVESKHYQQNS